MFHISSDAFGVKPTNFLQIQEEFLWECEMVKIKAQDLKSKEVSVSSCSSLQLHMVD